MRKYFYGFFIVLISLNCIVFGLQITEIKTQLFQSDGTIFFDNIDIESRAYEILKKNNMGIQENYLAVPWNKLRFQKKLNDAIPDIKLNGGFTVCESPLFRNVLPILKRIGIDTVFSPHAPQNEVFDGIKVLPIPHSAINSVDPAPIKDLWYSFIGVRSHAVRGILFNLPMRDDTIIKERTKWHWHNKPNAQELEKKEYQEVLARSRFSLCPRGVGPGTIRFWESLKAGAIPVLLSDEIKLIDGFDWDNAIIRLPENEAAKIEDCLRSVTPEREKILRENCLKIAQFFLKNDIIFPVVQYYLHDKKKHSEL